MLSGGDHDNVTLCDGPLKQVGSPAVRVNGFLVGKYIEVCGSIDGINMDHKKELRVLPVYCFCMCHIVWIDSQ